MELLSPARERPTVSFASDLDLHGDRLAVATREGPISYGELNGRVRDVAAGLGTGRKLVLVAAANSTECLVAYLAALQAGHPVMLVPGDNQSHIESLVARYDPDVVVSADRPAADAVVRRATSAHDLHPDLALLLCTSGSTGSAKFVRLSHRNVQSNAEAIAAYLDIRPTDRAVTSLPMHYCYGLSVINSHLARGAGLVLTDDSVVDPCFWDDLRAHGATSFAGVPYMFDLLDRIGFESMPVPSLRYVTQAGGRLAPDRVRRYAELGERNGWQLFVMYGQTEATARMAYLPPGRARAHPGAIGVPIPGGSFTIEPLEDGADGEGELVYRGPNVMLGYAEHPDDLALGATVDALRTGDIARRTTGGLYEVIGRRSRFVKLFGLRIDLEQVEEVLHRNDVDIMCTGDDDGLIVAAGRDEDAEHIRDLVTRHVGLPASRVRVVGFAELPRLGNGKPDYVAIGQRARAASGPPVLGSPTGVGRRATATGAEAVRAVYADVLRRDDVTDDSTFVGLGGDSLSYVEMSIRLEQTLGFLPAGWHTTPVGRLTPNGSAPRRLKQVETNVVLRAAAILLVVGTHADLFRLAGGAHVLLAVAGFNFARFQLTSDHMARSVARIAVPSMCWIAVVAATSERFDLTHAGLVHGQVGAGTEWRYWFIEALVQILAVAGLVFAVPAARRIERRHAFGFALAVLVAALAIRFDLLGLPDLHRRIYRPYEVLWLFAVGWAAARASSWAQRLVVTAFIVPAVPDFFGQPGREALVLAGLLALVWVPSLRVVWPVNRVVGLVAGASLYTYLTHWQVYPPLLDRYGSLAALGGATLAGIAVWSVVQRLTVAVTPRPAWPLATAGPRASAVVDGGRDERADQQTALVTMCTGGGMGTATIIERI